MPLSVVKERLASPSAKIKATRLPSGKGCEKKPLSATCQVSKGWGLEGESGFSPASGAAHRAARSTHCSAYCK